MTQQPGPHPDYDAYLDDPNDTATGFGYGADADTEAADEPDVDCAPEPPPVELRDSDRRRAVVPPIPGFIVTTPFGARGSNWSCDERDGLGVHTGDDYSTRGQIGLGVHATAAGAGSSWSPRAPAGGEAPTASTS